MNAKLCEGLLVIRTSNILKITGPKPLLPVRRIFCIFVIFLNKNDVQKTINAFWGSFDTSVIARVRRTDWQKYISHRQMTMWFKNAQQRLHKELSKTSYICYLALIHSLPCKHRQIFPDTHFVQETIHIVVLVILFIHPTLTSCSRSNSLIPSLETLRNRKLLVWVFEALMTCNS